MNLTPEKRRRLADEDSIKRILEHIGGLLVLAGGIALLLYGIPIVAAMLVVE